MTIANDELTTRVLLMAPTAKDVVVTHSLLDKAGMRCVACADLHHLSKEVGLGAGAVLITDEVISNAGIEELLDVLARHLHAAAQGERLAQAFHHRIDFVHQLVRGLPRQRVFVAEWLDPPFAAGHWVPEMVDLAGGDEVLGRPRERSFATTWDAVREAAPQLIVLAPCGFDLERTVSEAGAVPAMGARVIAVDGDAAYSRPGPRVAEGVAQLAHLLHPDDVEAPALPMRELS